MADDSKPVVSSDTANQSSTTSKEDASGKMGDSSAPPVSGTDNSAEKGQSEQKEVAKSVTNEQPAAPKPDVELNNAASTGASADAVAETAPETVEAASVDESAAPAAPATPATNKKLNGTSSAKKKSGGVPEHKSKKLNKKKSKAELHLDCEPGDLFLARMKGHAPWPSIICDEEILPESLLKSRPVTAALPDGSFKREDFAPGGKKQGERTYPVMFLYTNEFAWLPNTDLTPITPEACKNVEQKGKAKSLLAAYEVAGEGHNLEHYKTMLAEHQAAVQEDLDRQAEKEAEREAAKAAKAEKQVRRKSTTKVKEDKDEDDMDVDEEDGEDKPKSKKRKKAAEAEDESEEKPAKTPKLKLNGPKTPSTDKKSSAKSKSSSKKAAAKKDSDEDMEDAPAAEATPMSAAEIKEKKEKEVRYYRHKLQRGLLSRDDAPSDEEVKTASTMIEKLETFAGLEGDIIRSTKIHKVLRAIIRLPSIPKEETYELKRRSAELLQKWNTLLGSDDTEAHGDTQSKTTLATATTNAKDDKSAEEKSDSAGDNTSTAKSQEKTVSDSDVKVNGTSEEAKAEAPQSSETAVEQSKPASSELSNGIEKRDAPETATTASDAPKTDNKPAAPAEKPVEASS